MTIAANTAVVEVERLSKRYGETRALQEVSFRVRKGAIVALLGANGAGKTTTLAILLGLLTPSGGRVRVLGEDMLRQRHRALPRMNFFSPYVDLPQRLSVRENLEIYARLYGVAERRRRIEELSAELELDEHLPRPYGALSAGQKTRAALAKALLNEPELLLLDEPTASLDPDAADRIRGGLLRYRNDRGATILLASHNTTEVERLCDDAIIMRAGRVFAQGAPERLIARRGCRDLEQLFLDIVRRGEALPGASAA